MTVRKFLTVRNIAYIIVPSIIALLAFSNPLVCKAEELDSTSETEQIESVSSGDLGAGSSGDIVVYAESVDYTDQLTAISETLGGLSEQIGTDTELGTIQEQLDEVSVGVADLNTQLSDVVSLQTYITGILIFFVVVVLCKYVYKFFNLFF